MRYMLDTNICIHLIQRQPPEVMARFSQLVRGDVVMSAVTLAELRHGVERNPQIKPAADAALGHLLTLIPAIPFDTEAANQLRHPGRSHTRPLARCAGAAQAIKRWVSQQSNWRVEKSIAMLIPYHSERHNLI